MPVRYGTNAACSIIVPTWPSTGELGCTSVPKMRVAPLVGRIRPTSMRNVVVLPAPLGPRRPQTCPRSTWKPRSSTARTSAL